MRNLLRARSRLTRSVSLGLGARGDADGRADGHGTSVLVRLRFPRLLIQCGVITPTTADAVPRIAVSSQRTLVIDPESPGRNDDRHVQTMQELRLPKREPSRSRAHTASRQTDWRYQTAPN